MHFLSGELFCLESRNLYWQSFCSLIHKSRLMYVIEFVNRLTETGNGLSLLAALVITGLFGLQYKKLSELQEREEMLQNFLND